MRSFGWLLRAEALLLLSGPHVSSFFANASPSVNVALKAAFPSAPYLIELLEAAADEDPSVYYPILDRIADGYFDDASSDEQLYTTFLTLLKEDGLLSKPEALSSFQFGLSIHNSAPRIEAHYQYYNTAIEPFLKSEAHCETWLQFQGKQYCDPLMEDEHGEITVAITGELPFDRTLGEMHESIPSILYADLTSPSFRAFHKVLSKSANEGKTAYRVRYKPSSDTRVPLSVHGYGVSLDLKRTDYIVIDDRQAEEAKAGKKDVAEDSVTEEEINDLKPLTESELARLDLNAANYVTKSEQPLETLLRITQDFPKYSSMLASRNVSDQFVQEHRGNREILLYPGFSVMWVNGVQMDPRKMDAFSVLDHLRRERKLLRYFQDMGFSAPEAIQLLSHQAITEAQGDADSQRYDWRDEIEGGKVILWLNDIEKDRRYQEWPFSIYALLQRQYPGQLPSVRKDVHNAIVPVDFSDMKSVSLVAETLQDIIKRKVPCRWGLVPITATKEAAEQARVVYHIQETYGLAALMEYLETSLSKKKTASPHAGTFQNIMDNRKVKAEKRSLQLHEVLEDYDIGSRLDASRSYLGRLGADGPTPPFFVNGAPVPMNDEWLPNLSQRVSKDLVTIQRGVFEEQFTEDMWLPSVFLEGASSRRNPFIIPEDVKDIKLLNLANIYADHEGTLKRLPSIPVDEDSRAETWTTQLLVVADFDSSKGLELAMNAIEWRKANKHTEIIFLHNGKPKDTEIAKSAAFFSLIPTGKQFSHDELSNLYNEIHGLEASTEIPKESTDVWPETALLLQSLDFLSGEDGLVINGRKLGPIPENVTFTPMDYRTLFEFERTKRILPAATAVLDLGLFDKLATTYDTAKLCSLLAVSTVSDLPEGIFDLPPPVRTNYFNHWNASHTAITIGDNSTAIIQIIVSLDPASEVAQRWVPVIKALSELDGVYTRIYLNPREKLQELPVKRFYRYVLQSKPSFDDGGSLRALTADFKGLPKETLLTMAMDVPPSWLVAPKKSIYDLDNIKLSSVTADTVVDATYELENVLIEGHSRDVTAGMPPRGAQLVLSTAAEPHITDTIVMANLGYFQFKANPGYYSLKLQSGLSEEIFNIDSVGAMGYSAQPGDETTDVALLSFQGVTVFPRLSRKPGKEEEDVLDSLKTHSASDILSKGSAFVDGLLHRTGLKKDQTGIYSYIDTTLRKLVAYLWTETGRHADINIFSVASGHLYERMLNIMMVSVMRHTNHTVKFWFIEQFLSPSFKSFLPTMAKEYHFEFEMVTYKWPHWLRGQKEKQREIWGYKILFLDVLFPLDLDKVIFVDADQIVRTDMYELVTHDLKGAPYGFTPMCDSRTEMEGFRFWKQGYWKNFLRGLPYHISALYVVDLKRFRQIAAGDRLRQQYHQLSADPNSLSNLDQDLPNNMQMVLPIHSLPQEWLWCETWCSDESLKDARTIDLCNNPLTKEPKLDRARRQVPEWTVYDDEIAALAKRTKMEEGLLKGDAQESALDERTETSVEEKSSMTVRDEL